MLTIPIEILEGTQVVHLPADMAYEGVEELVIFREGDVVTLRPARPSWTSFFELPKADDEYLQERPVIVSDEGGGDSPLACPKP
ncbi:MAG: type II toxin-antitoxin system VapB family antitoxin [Pseudomonadota bacterium]